MLSKTLVLAAAAAGLMATAAFAQDATYPDKTLTPPDKIQNSPTSPSTVNPMPAPAATDQAVNVSATVTEFPSGATVTQELITNGPVPDTAQNRARYGGPQSHAGKMTRPVGN